MILQRFFLSGCCLLMASCQTFNTINQRIYKKDGPPVATKVAYQKPKPAQPKVEPRSRYGNPDSYHVLGKTYHVLASSNAFKQTGLASWYGTKFHAKRTSSGEPYNMHAMTAAHKTLPLPTYVTVKNQDNGREVVVKVNDRGPFHDGRIIDLSYAAAKALGVVKHGVARVIIESIRMNNAVEPQFYLQIGAFKEQGKALQYQAFVKRFLDKARVSVEEKATNHVVIVGPFKAKGARNTIKKQLAAHGIQSGFSFMR